MTVEQFLKYIMITAGIAVTLFLFPFLLKAFAPFAASFVIAALCQKSVLFLKKKLGISRGISSAIIVTAFVAIILGLLIIIVSQLITQAKNLISALPDAISSFRERVNLLFDSYNGLRGELSPEAAGLVDGFILKLEEYASSTSRKVTDWALNGAADLAMALPNILIFLVMLILGTFFFIKDYPLVINFFRELFPKKVSDFFLHVRDITARAFSSYVKAQFYLMLMTSLLITVCLWITGKENALLWGIICGFVDVLPLLGTAAVLVPWAIVSFIYGDMYSFAALLIIQCLVFVVRQLAEPKIISHQIGIHPILTLVSIYVGLKFFGIIGVIIAPVVTLLGVNLYVSYKERM